MIAEEMGLAEQVPIKGIIESTNLELLGLTQQTERSLGTFQIIGGGWNICNSWAGIVGTLAIGISEGGTILLLYGIVIMLVFGGCCATTLAELSSVYPTAGGQYHWTSILSPKKYSRVLVIRARSLNKNISQLINYPELLLWCC